MANDDDKKDIPLIPVKEDGKGKGQSGKDDGAGMLSADPSGEPDGDSGGRKGVKKQPNPGTQEPTVKDPARDDWVVVGCKIPMGVILDLSRGKLELQGVNAMPADALRSYGGIGFTRIKRSDWELILTEYRDWPPLVNGAVFLSDRKG